MVSISTGSWWFYFIKISDGFVKCKSCDFVVKQGETKSTGSLSYHLKTKHPKLFEQRNLAHSKELLEVEKLGKQQPKIPFKRTHTEMGGDCSISAIKRPQLNENTQTIVDAMTQWNADGEKTKAIDRLITENTLRMRNVLRMFNFFVPKNLAMFALLV